MLTVLIEKVGKREVRRVRERFAPINPLSPPLLFCCMLFPALQPSSCPEACSYVNRVRVFGDNLYTPPLSFFLLALLLNYQCLSNITFVTHFLTYFPLSEPPSPIKVWTFSIAAIFSFFFLAIFLFLLLLLLLLDHIYTVSSHPSDPLLLLLVLFTTLFLPFHLIVSLWISLSPKSFFLLLGFFFPLCYTISPSFMLPFIFMLSLPLYICAHSLCLSFCSAPVVRPYEMNWYKWHFMGPCSTTRLNTAGNHKSHCLMRMPLLMCSIWFNASDRWGENRRWGLRGEVERELRDKNGDKRDK